MGRTKYISVIVPLKLDWMPTYRTDLDLPAGTRVHVSMAHKQYVGVVAGETGRPDVPESRILPVEGTADLPPVSLSVGVAFSDRKDPQGDIFHDADSALYRVKEAGRKGCAVYADGQAAEAEEA